MLYQSKPYLIVVYFVYHRHCIFAPSVENTCTIIQWIREMKLWHWHTVTDSIFWEHIMLGRGGWFICKLQCRRRRCSQSQLLFALFDGICSHLLMLFYEDQCWWYCHLSDLPVLKSADALTVLPQGCIYFVYTYPTSCWNYCSLLNLWLKTLILQKFV